MNCEAGNEARLHNLNGNYMNTSNTPKTTLPSEFFIKGADGEDVLVTDKILVVTLGKYKLIVDPVPGGLFKLDKLRSQLHNSLCNDIRLGQGYDKTLDPLVPTIDKGSSLNAILNYYKAERLKHKYNYNNGTVTVQGMLCSIKTVYKNPETNALAKVKESDMDEMMNYSVPDYIVNAMQFNNPSDLNKWSQKVSDDELTHEYHLRSLSSKVGGSVCNLKGILDYCKYIHPPFSHALDNTIEQLVCRETVKAIGEMKTVVSCYSRPSLSLFSPEETLFLLSHLGTSGMRHYDQLLLAVYDILCYMSTGVKGSKLYRSLNLNKTFTQVFLEEENFDAMAEYAGNKKQVIGLIADGNTIKEVREIVAPSWVASWS